MRPQPELCTRPSGYAEDIVCWTDSITLIDLHLKRLAYHPAIRKAGSNDRTAAAHPPVPHLVPHEPVRRLRSRRSHAVVTSYSPCCPIGRQSGSKSNSPVSGEPTTRYAWAARRVTSRGTTESIGTSVYDPK
jgi:hypothetical protein